MNLKEKNIKCKYIFLIMNLISYLYIVRNSVSPLPSKHLDSMLFPDLSYLLMQTEEILLSES